MNQSSLNTADNSLTVRHLCGIIKYNGATCAVCGKSVLARCFYPSLFANEMERQPTRCERKAAEVVA